MNKDMIQGTRPRPGPDYQTVADAVLTSIADDQCIPPEECSLQKTLNELGYGSTIEVLNLAHLVERRLKLVGMATHGRIEFLLGANDRSLLHVETVEKIIRRVFVRIHAGS